MNNIYHQCQYLCSAHLSSQLPPEHGSEIAFAGRSNAGKSSAINVITRQKALARVSRTPGRTQSINFFRVDDSRCIVDLPGYGYAKVPDNIRRKWDKTLERFLSKRQSLCGLFLVMDIRHPLQPGDWQLINWTAASNLALHILLTKADKLSKGAAKQRMQQVVQQLEQQCINATLQLFSAHTHQGIDDAHSMLDTLFGFK